MSGFSTETPILTDYLCQNSKYHLYRGSTYLEFALDTLLLATHLPKLRNVICEQLLN